MIKCINHVMLRPIFNPESGYVKKESSEYVLSQDSAKTIRETFNFGNIIVEVIRAPSYNIIKRSTIVKFNYHIDYDGTRKYTSHETMTFNEDTDIKPCSINRDNVEKKWKILTMMQ